MSDSEPPTITIIPRAQQNVLMQWTQLTGIVSIALVLGWGGKGLWAEFNDMRLQIDQIDRRLARVEVAVGAAVGSAQPATTTGNHVR